jgi:hypothetical protein
MLTPKEHQEVLSELRLVRGRIDSLVEEMENERHREMDTGLDEQIQAIIPIARGLGLTKVAMMLEEDYESMKKFADGEGTVDSIA